MRAFMALMVAAAALGAGAGCGADDVSPSEIAEAAERTTAAGGARIEMEMTMPGPGGEEIELVATGVTDMAQQKGRMTIDLSRVPGGEGELEQIFEGFVLWMRMPALDERLPDGAEWVRIDLRKATKAAGIDIGQFAQGGNDASKQLEFLRATGEVEKEGRTEVRGVTTTHYSGTIDYRKYPKLVPAAERARARKSVEAIIELAGGQSKVPVEVWIDEKDLVRRMRMDVPMKLPGQRPVDMEMDYELYDFGIPVDVEPPPADEVIDYTELAAEAARRRVR